MNRKGGWYGEPGRHADAARGVKTGRKAERAAMMQRQSWQFRIIDEMGIANKFLDTIFENPYAADKLERKLNWMIRFIREKGGGVGEKHLRRAEEILSQRTGIYEERVVQLEQTREAIHNIIHDEILMPSSARKWKRITKRLGEKGYLDWEVREILR